MNRRELLALTGLLFLQQTSRAQKASSLEADLVLVDAPLRTALELLLRGFGENNYVIENHVFGLVSVRRGQLGFEELLKSVCTKSTQPLQWTNENKVLVIKPQPDLAGTSQEEIMARVQQAKLPIVEGIPCRMAGALFQGSKVVAILEVGAPPDSTVQIVAEGNPVEILSATYRVSKITPTELTLVGAKKTLRVPLAPLVPLKR